MRYGHGISLGRKRRHWLTRQGTAYKSSRGGQEEKNFWKKFNFPLTKIIGITVLVIQKDNDAEDIPGVGDFQVAVVFSNHALNVFKAMSVAAVGGAAGFAGEGEVLRLRVFGAVGNDAVKAVFYFYEEGLAVVLYVKGYGFSGTFATASRALSRRLPRMTAMSESSMSRAEGMRSCVSRRMFSCEAFLSL